ncbi:zinc finger CCHC domain-containing protein 8-like [Asterias rubens]|uniref:zinc finger CCHC domain-containing protein 8-like n=1 Tax=Asterias rubens TaxID=7604 RepID=UPI001455AA88|nr:zinc finger CCHC domain-containing protein 8-like [Asterias rubens]
MYTLTGNVQYYQRFCLDSMGRPLVNGNPQVTEGWDIPVYPVIFHEALPIDETERPNQQRQKRSKATCWNCGQEDHSLRDCPVPRDLVKISMAKKEFMEQNEGNAMMNKRYHKDEAVDQRFANFKPGQLSTSLREALGLDEKQVPPYIFQMRTLGYPPGYMKQAEVLQSGLTVYDVKGEAGNEPGEINPAVKAPTKTKYDPSKLIDYPGFNVPLPEGVREPGGVPPMQAGHSKDAFQLFMTPPRGSGSERKRGRDFHEDPEKKRPRVSSSSEMDMDVVKDSSGTPRRGDSSFKPPLPPTPVPETPPPLPTSTPPITPGRTPRFVQADTPSEFPPGVDSETSADPDSATVSQSSASQGTSRSASPSMDDLELMQRRLEEALMQAAEEGSSLVCNTESSNERLVVNNEEFIVDSVGEDDDNTNNVTLDDASQAARDGLETSTLPAETTVDENTQGASVLSSQTTELTNEIIEDSSTAQDGSVVVDAAEDNKSQALSLDTSTANPESPNGNTENLESTIPMEGYDTAEAADLEAGEIVDSDLDATPNRSGVPHLSKFAVGISPHENENLSKSTGMLKRIMSVFKRKDKGK